MAAATALTPPAQTTASPESAAARRGDRAAAARHEGHEHPGGHGQRHDLDGRLPERRDHAGRQRVRHPGDQRGGRGADAQPAGQRDDAEEGRAEQQRQPQALDDPRG